MLVYVKRYIPSYSPCYCWISWLLLVSLDDPSWVTWVTLLPPGVLDMAQVRSPRSAVSWPLMLLSQRSTSNSREIFGEQKTYGDDGGDGDGRGDDDVYHDPIISHLLGSFMLHPNWPPPTTGWRQVPDADLPTKEAESQVPRALAVVVTWLS